MAESGNGAIGIYPGDIAPSSSVTVIYVYTPDEGLGTVDIPNTVCTYYTDEGEDGSTDIVEYFNVDVDALCADFTVTTPITLSQFKVEKLYDGYSFNWTTATETSNIGFNVYGLRGQTLFKLNDEMILSQAINSFEPLDYNYLHLEGVDSTISKFFLEDIDTKGKSTKHGPFELDIQYGENADIADAQTDWQEFKSQNAQALLQKVAKQNGKKAGAKSLASSTNVDGSQLVTTIHITVEETGLQRVSYSQLSELGVDAKSLSLGRFTLTDTDGEAVAVRVVKPAGNTDGFIEFVGHELETFYDDVNVYQLALTNRNNDAKAVIQSSISKSSIKTKGKNGASMPAAYYMHTERLDDNLVYTYTSVPEEPWFLDDLIAFRSANSVSFELPISDLYYDQAIPATLSTKAVNAFDLPDSDNPDGFVQLFADSTVVDETEVFTKEMVELKSEIELQAQQQSVTAELLLTPMSIFNYAVMYVDEFALTYPRKHVAIDGQLIFQAQDEFFKVGGFNDSLVNVYAQSEDGNTHYLGQHQVSATNEVTFNGLSQQADYFVIADSKINQPDLRLVSSENLSQLQVNHLVVSHPQFVGERLDQYLQTRNTEAGDVTKVVTTDSIYQQYSGGIRDAAAIKAFVKDLSNNGELKSVMLVGGDVYDYNDYLGFGAVSFVPTMYRETDEVITFAPTDVLFGDVNGDQIPDIPVGRLPVRNNAELDTLLAKMELFNQQGNNKTAVLSADEQGILSAYNFVQSSERVADALEPAGWQVTRAYIDQLGSRQAKTVLLDSLNAGSRLSVYTGHSSSYSWSWKNLFSTTDAEQLTNTHAPTAYLQWGCYTTYFVSPQYDSLSHVLMLSGDQGAAAVIGSSTLTDASAEADYAEFLQEELTNPDNNFGQAMVKSQQRFTSVNGLAFKDIVWGINLLGDPLLSLSAQ